MGKIEEIDVEILLDGKPFKLVTLACLNGDTDKACNTAKNAVWMQQLRSGDEIMLDRLSAQVYHN